MMPIDVTFVCLECRLPATTDSSLFQQLDHLQRLKVFACAIVLLVLTALLFLVVRAGSRIARWYARPSSRNASTQPTMEERWTRKPTVSSRDRENWRKQR